MASAPLLSLLLVVCTLRTEGTVHTAAGGKSDSAGVDWFGDRRMWMQVPHGADVFRFYDVIYEDDLCTGGGSELRADAVDGFVYFGRLLAAKPVVDVTECQRQCHETAKCRAVNYYRPKSLTLDGHCELLADTQWDRPRWMRRYPNAVYYESIRCEALPDDDDDVAPVESAPNSNAAHFLDGVVEQMRQFGRRAKAAR